MFPSRVDPRQQYRPTLAPVPEVLPELFFQLTLKLCNMEPTSLALIGLLAMIAVITVIALAT